MINSTDTQDDQTETRHICVKDKALIFNGLICHTVTNMRYASARSESWSEPFVLRPTQKPYAYIYIKRTAWGELFLLPIIRVFEKDSETSMIFISQTCVLRLIAVAFVASSTVSAVSIRCARSEGKDCAYSQFHPEIAMGNELEVNSEAYIDSVPDDPFAEVLSNQKVVEAQFIPGVIKKIFKKKNKSASEEEASTEEELAPADTSAEDSSGNEGAGNTGSVEADLGSTRSSEEGQTEEGSTEAGHEVTIEESYTGVGNEEDDGNEDDEEELKAESEEVSAEAPDGESNEDNYGS